MVGWISSKKLFSRTNVITYAVTENEYVLVFSSLCKVDPCLKAYSRDMRPGEKKRERETERHDTRSVQK